MASILFICVCRRAGIEWELASRADQRVLRWCGHVERMDECRMARRVLMAEVSGRRVLLLIIKKGGQCKAVRE